jgi:hypothetical protein
MSVRQALFRQLQTAVRSVHADADVYPMGALPRQPPSRYVTYQRISGVHPRHLTAGTGLKSARWQVDVYANYAADADAISEAIRESMDNVRGTIGAAGQTEFVNGTFLEDDAEEFVPPIDASQTGRARVRMDFILWHPETITPGT